ncbi:hypothetical protein IFM89_039193 [Coptis chinensis]|uniref:Uncharacterized protein n=1 Tax=Coptis chinensis TaxID=261450 RepID=A0A835I7U3_9MAGN|nr:hypothetical protein IFM89_039193 [Coptis chinensis]
MTVGCSSSYGHFDSQNGLSGSLQRRSKERYKAYYLRAEDLIIIEGGRDEEGDLEVERCMPPSSPSSTVMDVVPKDEGLIVFFLVSSVCDAFAALITDGEGMDDTIGKMSSRGMVAVVLRTLVENAYYLCKPPERSARVSKTHPLLHQYIRKLLFTDLDKSSIEHILETAIRKLPGMNANHTS